MNEDDPGYGLAIKVQRWHLIATGKVCDLPPPQSIVDLYLWTPSRQAKDDLARAKWRELSVQEQEAALIWNPTYFKKMLRR